MVGTSHPIGEVVGSVGAAGDASALEARAAADARPHVWVVCGRAGIGGGVGGSSGGAVCWAATLVCTSALAACRRSARSFQAALVTSARIALMLALSRATRSRAVAVASGCVDRLAAPEVTSGVSGEKVTRWGRRVRTSLMTLQLLLLPPRGGCVCVLVFNTPNSPAFLGGTPDYRPIAANLRLLPDAVRFRFPCYYICKIRCFPCCVSFFIIATCRLAFQHGCRREFLLISFRNAA